MPALFCLTQDPDGRFGFALRDERGDLLLQGPPFADKASALRGIASVRAAAASTTSYRVRTAADGQLYFVLRTATLEVVGRSRGYASPIAIEIGISSTRESASVALIDDQTRR